MNIYIRQNDNDLLKYCTNQEVNLLRKVEKKSVFSPGQSVFLEDSSLGDLYVVLKGRIVLKQYLENGEVIDIDEYDDGEIFGETAFILAEKQSYQAIASEMSEVLIYSGIQLQHLMKTNPEVNARIQAAINDSLAEKQVRMTQKIV